MYKKIILTLLTILSFDLLNAQAMCVPNNLNAVHGNRSVSLSWRHVNDSSGDDLIFLECFPQCAIPNTATITHEVDNGGGGWFRQTDGNFTCWDGPDCDLNPNGVENTAIAVWGGQEMPVNSRMTFGPFDIAENSEATLGFLQSYVDGDWQVQQNTVEISIDNGITWEVVESSDGNEILDQWVPTGVDISEYAGQTIHVSFHYQCPQGWTEAWLVDHVAINVVENELRLSSEINGVSQIEEFANLYPRKNNYLDRDALIQKANLKRLDRTNYKPNNFRPNFSSFSSDSFEPNLISSDRNCSDPDNQSEVNIVLTEGGWPEEITWFLLDSISGETVLSGIAPFDTTLCLPNGFYIFQGVDSYGDGWNDAVMTITDVLNGAEYLNFTILTGLEAVQTFYLGTIAGCTDPLATNYNPDANFDDGSCEFELCQQDQIFLYCTPGNWPGEVSWYIYDSLGVEVTNGVTDDPQVICVPTGTYKVVGLDTYGDGWNNAILTGTDTSNSTIFSFTFNEGYSDSTYFYSGPLYGCTDWRADNYNPLATVDDSSCVYTECAEDYGYALYQDGEVVASTADNFHTFWNLENGKEYTFGVAAIYDNGTSDISTISSVPWNNVTFDPLSIELDTLIDDGMFDYNFSFEVAQDIFFTSPFEITSEKSLDINYESSLLYSDFNSSNFTNMYDPSGLFGGLWLLGDPTRASSDYFAIDSTLDSTNFAYINDDGIGAAGGAESAYLITNEITRSPGQRVFATFDVYFPQPYQSCSSPNGGINGEGYSEDLFFKVSSDYGGTWTVVDSTLGGNPNWTSRMFEITDELNGANSFIAALYYTDCNGNWAFGVAVDNFAIHLADESEIIAIDPYAGWVEAGSQTDVNISIPNVQSSYVNTTLELEAGYENLSIPVSFGLSLISDENDNNIIPLKNALHQNYPNPFNPVTTIPFDIVSTDQIRLSIYNIKGEMVRSLVNSNLDPGFYNIRWNGKTDSGINMPAGMYFIEFKGSNFRETGKMIYLK
ncbi:MAG: T9SS type A sorting domain-containing protein [Candidatus Neomarinimicrobiota bacterium]